MGEEQFDLVVIGGGPAGVRAAERVARSGRSVMLIEQHAVGGTCLNYGCMPAKSMIACGILYRDAHEAAFLGIDTDTIEYRQQMAVKHKDLVLKRMRSGMRDQLEKAGVTLIEGTAHITAPHRVEVDGKTVRGENILMCTGTVQGDLTIPTARARIPVIAANAAFDLPKLPARVAIVGAGYIGLEIASWLNMVGTEVTVVSEHSEILGFAGADIGRRMRLALSTVEFLCGFDVSEVDGNELVLKQKDQEGTPKRIETDMVIQVVSRTPRLSAVALKGLEYTDRGVVVDAKMRSNIPSLYAAGDVTGLLNLAHAAYRMADVAVNTMYGDGTDRFESTMVPWIVYTTPQLAGCGLHEEAARAEGFTVESSLFTLSANSRYAHAHFDPKGWCRLVYEVASGRIRGCFLMGEGVSEIIGQASVAISAGMTLRDLARTAVPHPTVSEALSDAADTAELRRVKSVTGHGFHPHL